MYIALLKSLRTGDKENALYALSELRTEIAFSYVLKGLGIDYDTAISLLISKNDDNITQYDKDLRDRVFAAIQNLINFSVCAEYQLFNETIETLGEDDVDFNSDEYEELIMVCKKYNDTYAAIENADIEYAGLIASKWIKTPASNWVTYWTMNDAKVRPWHMDLQGYTAPKDEFPSWMIPPIEYNCRCFLEWIEMPSNDASVKRIKGSANKVSKPEQLSDVYGESLAKCGRIFGSSHNYFAVKECDIDMLNDFVSKLKAKYYV